MKKDKKRIFRFLPGFAVYVLLFVLAVLFTQFLRSRASNMFLWFTATLPFLSLAYAFIGRAALQVYVTCSTGRSEKNLPVEYEIRIINNFFLPYPHVEADLREPSDSAARCENHRIILPLLPFGGCVLKKVVRFRYRGYYEIGVDSLYIRDIFGFFETRIDVSNFAGVSVSPRILKIERRGKSSVSDVPESPVKYFDVSERIEASDIRDYVPGDPVKNIHWKLSSKSDEIKIRQFSSSEKRHVYILCDMAGASPVPENDAGEIYDMLKKAVFKQKKDRKTKIKIKKIADEADENETAVRGLAGEASFFKDLKAYLSEKRQRAKYRRNIESGMSRENAEMAEMIDSLIKSSSKSEMKKRAKREKSRKKMLSDAEESGLSDNFSDSELLKQDLQRIFDTIGDSPLEIDDPAKAYGGRIKAEYAEDYDEFCADAVCEIALSAAADEIKNGNRCTLLWFDSREKGEIASSDITCGADFDEACARLSGAECMPYSAYVSGIASAITESSDVTVKTVTANIDPVSVGELAGIPCAFGGSGTGCVLEVLLFSPDERFESPSARRAYIDETVSSLLRRGIKMTQLRECNDSTGDAFFEAVVR